MKPGLMSILDTQQQPQTVGQPQQLQQQISHHETLMASANLLSPMGSGTGTGTFRFCIYVAGFCFNITCYLIRGRIHPKLEFRP